MTQSLLIIDDSEDIHELVAIRLKPEGLVLHRALDAQVGLDMAKQIRPDLILLDLEIPGMSGLDICHQLKSGRETRDIPVIFLTATTDVSTKARALDAGAVDYVTKPFDAVELRARVRAALRTKRFQDLLAVRAQIDGLTGLWNRGFFNDLLEKELRQFANEGSPVSLALLDVDKFKLLNDNHGHPFGDLALQTLSSHLSANLHEAGVPCRYGGEEFAIVIRGDTRHAALIAERLRREIEALRIAKGEEVVPVTVSIGVAGTDLFDAKNAVTPSLILDAADRALYEAKQGGRNRVNVATVTN